MIHRARKRFGQNFLHNPSLVAEILSAVNPQAHEHLVEIGPGKGVLTMPLSARCEYLDIIEIDRDLVEYLKNRLACPKHLNVVCADALKVNFADFRRSDETLRIIGNLPYNISTPLLFHLLEQQSCIRDMHFMLQKEVVDRICAQPGSKDFGRLSILLQLYLKPEKLFEVSPHNFRPVPGVESAFVRLTPRSSIEYSITDLDTLKILITGAFSKRRKTLRNALLGYLSANEIASAGVDPAARAEAIDIMGFVRLANLYFQKNSAAAG